MTPNGNQRRWRVLHSIALDCLRHRSYSALLEMRRDYPPRYDRRRSGQSAAPRDER